MEKRKKCEDHSTGDNTRYATTTSKKEERKCEDHSTGDNTHGIMIFSEDHNTSGRVLTTTEININ